MMLSPHFSLAELTVTTHTEIDNTPTPDMVERLRYTAGRMEEVRALLGKPIKVTSGFRCVRLNGAVGGSKNSAHIAGYAVDFVCPAFGTPMEVCRAIAASDLTWDQLIMEGGQWVHIAFGPGERREVLTMRKGRYYKGLRTFKAA